MLFFIFLAQKNFQGFSDLWQFINADLPYNIKVYTKIVVNETIPDSGHAFPGYISKACTLINADIPGGFSNDFQVADDRILGFDIP